MSRERKLSYDDVKKAIRFICKNNKSNEKVLITTREIQAVLKYKFDITVSSNVIRENGVSHRGYFEKAYSDFVSYNRKGSNQDRGLVVQPEKFLEEVDV